MGVQPGSPLAAATAPQIRTDATKVALLPIDRDGEAAFLPVTSVRAQDVSARDPEFRRLERPLLTNRPVVRQHFTHEGLPWRSAVVQLADYNRQRAFNGSYHAGYLLKRNRDLPQL